MLVGTKIDNAWLKELIAVENDYLTKLPGIEESVNLSLENQKVAQCITINQQIKFYEIIRNKLENNEDICEFLKSADVLLNGNKYQKFKNIHFSTSQCFFKEGLFKNQFSHEEIIDINLSFKEIEYCSKNKFKLGNDSYILVVRFYDLNPLDYSLKVVDCYTLNECWTKGLALNTEQIDKLKSRNLDISYELWRFWPIVLIKH